MFKRVYVRPALLDGKPRLAHDSHGRVIRYVEEGILKTLDFHLSRAIKRGDLEVVESKKVNEPQKGKI